MPYTIAIDVQMNHALDRLYKQLGEACAFAGLGESTGKLPTGTQFPTVEAFPSFYFGLSAVDTDLPNSWEIIGNNFASYCARYAFLHMVTAAEIYLADLWVWCQVTKAFHDAPAKTIIAETFESLVKKVRKRVRDMPLEQRVKNSLAALGLSSSPVQSRIDNLNALYKLRNCLVHRSGVVGNEDAPSGEFRCEWLKVTIEVGGIPVTELPALVPAGVALSAPIRAEVKTWKMGETVRLSVADCQGVATTLAFGCTHLRDEVIQKAKELLK